MKSFREFINEDKKLDSNFFEKNCDKKLAKLFGELGRFTSVESYQINVGVDTYNLFLVRIVLDHRNDVKYGDLYIYVLNRDENWGIPTEFVGNYESTIRFDDVVFENSKSVVKVAKILDKLSKFEFNVGDL